MPHFVYIIYSDSHDVYYKGESASVFLRLEYHNRDMNEYTRGKGPWRLVYYCDMVDRSAGLRREKEIKKLNRRSIEKLIRDPSNRLLS
jgi:putative endonuclease